MTREDVAGPRPGTDFIYQPDRRPRVVALLAGVAGALAMTSSRASGLVGASISVTTVPAAGNVAVGLALGVGDEVWGSLLQLVVNVTGMALAPWLTLVVEQTVWQRVSERRRRKASHGAQ